MPCPFFFPLGKQEQGNWLNAPRVPLGELHDGECRAQTSPFTLSEHCNTGYGRGRCGYFPEQAEADAVRFHLIADRGDRLEIQFILEKECWPLRHGTLTVLTDAPDEQDVLRQQAAKFAASYARRRDSRKTPS